MLALREAYGRPPCAPEKPCMAAAPFDFAADGGEELHSQLLLSMEANGAAVVRGWAGKAGAEAWFDDGACRGHNWHDTLPFEALWEGDEAGVLYTNQQLMQAFHPANVRGTYVYDYSFGHCSGDGERSRM